MKSKLCALSILMMFCSWANATQLKLASVKQPLYLATDEIAQIRIMDVPFVSFYSDPEWRFGAIATPFTPLSDGSLRDPVDANLTTVYGIEVSGTYADDGSKDILVIIDLSKAQQPEGYPFTLEQVVEAVETCVRLMYPDSPAGEGMLRIELKKAPDAEENTE